MPKGYPNLKKPAASASVCGGCHYWTAPQGKGGGGYIPKGRCRRFPEEQPKDAADWCGEWKIR